MKRNGANLTDGKPVKLILQFAIPVFLGNLFQLFYGLIDTKRAQVEDIVKRKTNISADKIVITPIVVTDAE